MLATSALKNRDTALHHSGGLAASSTCFCSIPVGTPATWLKNSSDSHLQPAPHSAEQITVVAATPAQVIYKSTKRFVPFFRFAVDRPRFSLPLLSWYGTGEAFEGNQARSFTCLSESRPARPSAPASRRSRSRSPAPCTYFEQSPKVTHPPPRTTLPLRPAWLGQGSLKKVMSGVHPYQPNCCCCAVTSFSSFSRFKRMQ